MIPGNHDAYIDVKWREALAHWSDYMRGDGAIVPEDAAAAFPFLRRRGEVALIGLSTAVASPPTFATGKLGRRQVGEARGRPRTGSTRRPAASSSCTTPRSPP